MTKSESFLNNRVVLYCGDSALVLTSIPDCSIDSIVTDPPYALTSIVKRFANSPRSEATENTGNPYGRTGRGFMGQRWDTGDTAHDSVFWSECLRVLKPGGHLLAFAGTRTYHRLAVAIEDAGFEIRDMVSWLYGSGFPKSHNQGNGWGTALKPACEPICMARKPLSEKTVASNVLKHGTGAINIDDCRVAGETPAADRRATARQNDWAPPREAGTWANDRRSAETYRAERPGEALGRWPANLIHDGSEEVIAAFPSPHGAGAARDGSADPKVTEDYQANAYGKYTKDTGRMFRIGDSGSAARFFYSAKADADERVGSGHPTVKPIDLLQYLCRLITPEGGTVLDPFAGTGTTGEAAFREGFNAVLIEREEEYQADIRRRMALVMSGPDERKRETIKAKSNGKLADAGPLFASLYDEER